MFPLPFLSLAINRDFSIYSQNRLTFFVVVVIENCTYNRCRNCENDKNIVNVKYTTLKYRYCNMPFQLQITTHNKFHQLNYKGYE